MTVSPSGLFSSDASFASSLLNDTPAEQVSPVSSRTRARMRRATSVALSAAAVTSR